MYLYVYEKNKRKTIVTKEHTINTMNSLEEPRLGKKIVSQDCASLYTLKVKGKITKIITRYGVEGNCALNRILHDHLLPLLFSVMEQWINARGMIHFFICRTMFNTFYSFFFQNEKIILFINEEISITYVQPEYFET